MANSSIHLPTTTGLNGFSVALESNDAMLRVLLSAFACFQWPQEERVESRELAFHLEIEFDSQGKFGESRLKTAVEVGVGELIAFDEKVARIIPRGRASASIGRMITLHKKQAAGLPLEVEVQAPFPWTGEIAALSSSPQISFAALRVISLFSESEIQKLVTFFRQVVQRVRGIPGIG